MKRNLVNPEIENDIFLKEKIIPSSIPFILPIKAADHDVQYLQHLQSLKKQLITMFNILQHLQSLKKQLIRMFNILQHLQSLKKQLIMMLNILQHLQSLKKQLIMMFNIPPAPPVAQEAADHDVQYPSSTSGHSRSS